MRLFVIIGVVMMLLFSTTAMAKSNMEMHGDGGGDPVNPPEQPGEPDDPEPQPAATSARSDGGDSGHSGVSTKRGWKVVYEDEYVIVSHYRTYQVSAAVCGPDVMYCNEKIYPGRQRTEYKEPEELEVIDTSDTMIEDSSDDESSEEGSKGFSDFLEE